LNWFILAVTAGGALESAARYLVSIGFGRLLGSKLPWGTRFVDIAGSLLIGLFAIRWILPQAVRILLTVGICGGYTTFSTFSLDFFHPFERGELAAAGACMIASPSYSPSAR
jgi:CrcB protein